MRLFGTKTKLSDEWTPFKKKRCAKPKKNKRRSQNSIFY